MSNLPRPEAKGLKVSQHAAERMVERKLSDRIVRHAVAWGIERIEDSEGQVRRYILQMSGNVNGHCVDYALHVIVDGLLVVTAYIKV